MHVLLAPSTNCNNTILLYSVSNIQEKRTSIVGCCCLFPWVIFSAADIVILSEIIAVMLRVAFIFLDRGNEINYDTSPTL